MEIKFLGTGGAFDWQYGTSAATVQTKEHLFLIDCGPSAFPQLMKHELIDKFDYLVLTHLHGDHVGSLFQVLCQRSILGLETPIIVPNEAFAKTITELLDLQWYSRERDILVGFDDIDIISHLETPLTTIAQDKYAIGAQAAELLINKIEGRKKGNRQIVIPTELIVRKSTIPAGE